MATSTYIVKAQYGRFIIDNSSFLAIFIPAGQCNHDKKEKILI
jgi:hypothetical protein